MANAGKLKGSTPYRGFHIGFPGSGKTGALASLANAGYKLRILDYGGNPQSLIGFADDRALANIDIVSLQDRMRNGDSYVEVMGIPEAFNNGLKLMQEWKYKDDDGTEVNLGKSSEWGRDTIVVIDDLTAFSKAAKARAMKMNNKTPKNMTSAVWGMAVSDVLGALGIMKSEKNGFHLIVNCHKQILGPSDFIQQGDDDQVKEKKLEMIADGMIPPRIYPVGPTKPASQTIHGELPVMLDFFKAKRNGKDVRLIDTIGDSQIDVKVPGKGLKQFYGIETGLAEIFEALGYKAPGF